MNPDAIEEEGGKVYFIGAGPGSRALVTVRGAAILAAADLVAFEDDGCPDVLALCPASTQRVSHVAATLGAREVLADRLAAAAGEGKVAVWLSPYDGLGFGEGLTLFDLVQQRKVAVEVVPGVGAYDAMAAADLSVAAISILRVPLRACARPRENGQQEIRRSGENDELLNS